MTKPKGITLAEVRASPKFQELLSVLSQQGAQPKLTGGLVERGWTNHDIDINVSKGGVKVPLDLLLLDFGRRRFPVSLKIVTADVCSRARVDSESKFVVKEICMKCGYAKQSNERACRLCGGPIGERVVKRVATASRSI